MIKTMRKAIFLDRDGVILKERGEYNFLPDHIIMVEGIVEALQKITSKEFDIIIITNQGGIALGKYKARDANYINDTIIQFFKSYGVKILDIIYCPHHPDVSKCICRKPDSLMIEKMMHIHEIDPTASWLVGDQERDIEAGQKAGLNTILIKPNDDLNNYLHLMV
jgi:D-glycero-D-manno-heptose 1,7-bisphosphate phosphatase